MLHDQPLSQGVDALQEMADELFVHYGDFHARCIVVFVKGAPSRQVDSKRPVIGGRYLLYDCGQVQTRIGNLPGYGERHTEARHLKRHARHHGRI